MYHFSKRLNQVEVPHLERNGLSGYPRAAQREKEEHLISDSVSKQSRLWHRFPTNSTATSAMPSYINPGP
jgi:hypothetical protein